MVDALSRLKAKFKSRRPKSSDSSAGTVTLIPDPLSSASVAISMGDSAPSATATVNLGPILSIPIPTATSTTGGPPSDPSLQSSQDRDLWEKAYQATSQDTKKWIEALPPSTERTYAQDLIPIVHEIEKKHQSSALRIRVGEKDIFWKDYAPRVISLLTTIGDVAIQSAPALGNIVWSALKVILQIPANSCEELTAIFGSTEKVLSIVRRGKVYEKIYTTANFNTELLDDLKSKLIVAYTKSLDLLAHVALRLKDGYRNILFSITNPGEAKSMINQLTDCENDLALTAQVCADLRSANADEHIIKLLSSRSDLVQEVHDGVRGFLEEAEKTEILDALDYFSLIKFVDQHRRRAESRTAGTGEWLLQHQKFQEWEQDPKSRILWLQGTVGMGKSLLASKVIDRFRAKSKEVHNHDLDSDEGFAFFYCERGETELQNPLSTLQSFVRQLSTSSRYPKMMRKSLLELYREMRRNGETLDFKKCKEQVLESVNLYHQTTLVIDGLDECDVRSRHRLIAIMADLIREARRPVKIFISSRREEDIVMLLPAESIIEIDARDNRDDIEKFIGQRIEEEIERKALWKIISDDLKSEIKSRLCKGSDGMFRWAYLQMEQLAECKQVKDIKQRLGTLPKTLNAAYGELFEQMTSNDQVILQRAVMWVMCAFETLSSSQLLAAVQISPLESIDGLVLDVDIELQLTEEDLRSICRHLLVKDSKKEEWKFPHASVIEYFEKEHKWTIEKAHSLVAKLSLLCLVEGYFKSNWRPASEKNQYVDQQPEVTEDFSDDEDYEHPVSDLRKYMWDFWFKHIQSLESSKSRDAQLSQILKRFMGINGSLFEQQSSSLYRGWCHGYSGPTRAIDTFLPAENPIFGACGLGFFYVLEDCWSAAVNVSQVNEKGHDLLAIAALFGHEILCEKLIELGADVNKQLDHYSSTALCVAIAYDQANVVKCLLAKKADPNLILRTSALCASARPDITITKLLLEAGAGPNIQCLNCLFGSALESAAYFRNFELMQLLVEYGADVNLCTQHGNYGSPLAAATSGGGIKAARWLVQKGAKVNVPLKYGEHGSALAAACAGFGGVKMVQFLIEEAAADPSILRTSPPSAILTYDIDMWRESKRYLVENGYVADADIDWVDIDSEDTYSV